MTKGKWGCGPASPARLTCPTRLPKLPHPAAPALDAPAAPRYGSGDESLDSTSLFDCAVPAGFCAAVAGPVDLHSGRGVALRVGRWRELAKNHRAETIGRRPGSL